MKALYLGPSDSIVVGFLSTSTVTSSTLLNFILF